MKITPIPCILESAFTARVLALLLCETETSPGRARDELRLHVGRRKPSKRGAEVKQISGSGLWAMWVVCGRFAGWWVLGGLGGKRPETVVR